MLKTKISLFVCARVLVVPWCFVLAAEALAFPFLPGSNLTPTSPPWYLKGLWARPSRIGALYVGGGRLVVRYICNFRQ
jgi:hypothetical protein